MTTIKKIWGPPGTGKTTRMLEILREEIRNGVKPHRIAFLTYSKAAAEEAWERVANELKTRPRYFCTIHAAALRILGLGGGLWGWQQTKTLSEKTGMRFSAEAADDDFDVSGDNGEPIKQCIEYAAARMISLDEAVQRFERYNVTLTDVIGLDRVMHEIRQEDNVKTFSDLFSMYLAGPQPASVDVMIIDEAQDLSRVQWHVVRAMWQECKRVYICGDDDQTIYEFMGADANGFLEHECDEEEVLRVSWRVPQKIGSFANRIIKEVKHRKDKNTIWRDEPGEIERIYADEFSLPITVGEETMILTRHKKQGRSIYFRMTEDGDLVSFNDESVVTGPHARALDTIFRLRNGELVKRSELIHVFSYIHGKEEAIKRLRDDAADKNKHANIGKSMVDIAWKKIESGEFGYALGKTYYDAKRFEDLSTIVSRHGEGCLLKEPKTRIMTMHGSKGREANHVILLTDCYKAVILDQDSELADTERKVAYVAATRARERLTIVEPNTSMYLQSLAETEIGDEGLRGGDQ